MSFPATIGGSGRLYGIASVPLQCKGSKRANLRPFSSCNVLPMQKCILKNIFMMSVFVAITTLLYKSIRVIANVSLLFCCISLQKRILYFLICVLNAQRSLDGKWVRTKFLFCQAYRPLGKSKVIYPVKFSSLLPCLLCQFECTIAGC